MSFRGLGPHLFIFEPFELMNLLIVLLTELIPISIKTIILTLGQCLISFLYRYSRHVTISSIGLEGLELNLPVSLHRFLDLYILLNALFGVEVTELRFLLEQSVTEHAVLYENLSLLSMLHKTISTSF